MKHLTGSIRLTALLFAILLTVGSLSGCVGMHPGESHPDGQESGAPDEAESVPNADSPAEDSFEESEEASLPPVIPSDSFTVMPGEYAMTLFDRLTAEGFGRGAKAWKKVFDGLLGDSEFGLYSAIPNAKKRIVAAEGYILPGTYTWPQGSDEETIARTLLGGMEAYWTEEKIAEAAAKGYTVDEVLCIASIIETESTYNKSPEVKAGISAVIANRLRTGSKLQMDYPIFYLKEMKKYGFSYDSYESLYDTYICKKLPAGPIGMPDELSIEAALNPPQNKDFYFVWNTRTGEYFFAETYAQHQKNWENIKKQNKEADKG